MEWDEYKEKIEILDDHHFQQEARLHNVLMAPPIGAAEEE